MAPISPVTARQPTYRLSYARILAIAGALLVAICLAIALLAPAMVSWGWLADPQDSLSFPIHAAPSAEHWFGTSRQGYDVFSRTLFGTRVALQIVGLATGMSLALGVPLGLASGYFGGKFDRLLVFAMDAAYALPGLLLSATLAFVVGRGVVNAAIATSIAYVPQYFRVVRNHTTSVKSELFVEAAQALGASPWRVLARYVFGNVVQSVPVLFALNAADAVLILGGLGFLGLGVPETVPEWGYALRQALDALPTGVWWTALFPGLAMTLLVTGMSLLGEGLSDRFASRDR